MKFRKSLRPRRRAAALDHYHSCHIHASRRAFQHYGVAISEHDIRMHEEMIAGGSAALVGRVGNGRDLYRIDDRKRDVTYWTVYCPVGRMVVTYLKGPGYAGRSKSGRFMGIDLAEGASLLGIPQAVASAARAATRAAHA